MNTKPLIIDLDGTLIRSDLLAESAFLFLKKNPFKVFLLLIWLFKGKAELKTRLAENTALDIHSLPYVTDVIDLIHVHKSKGAEIVLATASARIYADQVANFLNIFDKVIATENGINLSASRKANALCTMYGKGGFDYVGNSMDDLEIWEVAQTAIAVNPEQGVIAKAMKIGNLSLVINERPTFLKSLLKALRIHQWAKNFLLFVPLLASHKLSDLSLVVDGVVAFILFGLCASSVYLLNDLLDLEDDRHHSSKRKRPFAAGTLSIKLGVALFPLLLLIAFVGAFTLLPLYFGVALVVYYVLTVLYSFLLKRVVVVDVITLASLYTMRIIAGTFAFAVSLTFWMLAFSMFIFLSLALVKRFAELHEARADGKTGKTRGRGYFPDDLEMISSLGASSGYIAVMVLALYIQDSSTIALYTQPKVIWLACPLLLFWISRTWLLANRGQMHDDPVIFAIKDRTSIIIGALFGLIFWLAV